MYYISRIIYKFLRRVRLIIKITLGSLFDIIKLILSPLYLLVKLIKWLFIPRRAGFFPSNKRRRRKTDFQKTDKYRTWAKQNKPYLTKDSLLKDVQSLHHQINDPLGGIKNIQDEHSRYIQKSSKNKISCLEDNMDMVLDKLKAFEDRMSKYATIEDLKRLPNPSFMSDDSMIAQFNISDFKGDTEGDKVREEEYDYHQEHKYWSKRAKEAYDDHMSEPKEFHDE